MAATPPTNAPPTQSRGDVRRADSPGPGSVHGRGSVHGQGSARTPRVPRGALILAVPLLAILLVAFFVFLRFPFERFSSTLARETGSALGAEVAIGSLDPAFTIGGPGLVAEARLRPAWSASWLAGEPAVRLDADSDIGAVTGTLTLGAEPAFDGRLDAVDMSRLPLERFARGAALDGELDLVADLRLRGNGPVGNARFEARDGSVSAPQLPIAVPYEKLQGSVRFGEDGSVTLEDVALDGPMVSARVEGGTAPGPSLWLAPLELDVLIEVSARNLRPSLRAAGLRMGPDGSAELQVRGSLAAPVIR